MLAADRRNGVDERQQVRDVMTVDAEQDQRERDAAETARRARRFPQVTQREVRYGRTD
jgi:hypothetical protein